MGIGKWGGPAYVTCGRHNFRSLRRCYMSVWRALKKIFGVRTQPCPLESHPAARLWRFACLQCVAALSISRWYLPVTFDRAQQRLPRNGGGCGRTVARVTVRTIYSWTCAANCLRISERGAACCVWARCTGAAACCHGGRLAGVRSASCHKRIPTGVSLSCVAKGGRVERAASRHPKTKPSHSQTTLLCFLLFYQCAQAPLVLSSKPTFCCKRFRTCN